MSSDYSVYVLIIGGAFILLPLLGKISHSNSEILPMSKISKFILSTLGTLLIFTSLNTEGYIPNFNLFDNNSNKLNTKTNSDTKIEFHSDTLLVNFPNQVTKETEAISQEMQKLANSFYRRAYKLHKIYKYDKANSDYKKAIMLNKSNSDIFNSAAWFYATCSEIKYRDSKIAIELSLKAIELNHCHRNIDTLAAAYAQNNNFTKAIEAQIKAVNMVTESSDTELIEVYKKRLNKYKQHISL